MRLFARLIPKSRPRARRQSRAFTPSEALEQRIVLSAGSVTTVATEQVRTDAKTTEAVKIQEPTNVEIRLTDDAQLQEFQQQLDKLLAEADKIFQNHMALIEAGRVQAGDLAGLSAAFGKLFSREIPGMPGLTFGSIVGDPMTAISDYVNGHKTGLDGANAMQGDVYGGTIGTLVDNGNGTYQIIFDSGAISLIVRKPDGTIAIANWDSDGRYRGTSIAGMSLDDILATLGINATEDELSQPSDNSKTTENKPAEEPAKEEPGFVDKFVAEAEKAWESFKDFAREVWDAVGDAVFGSDDPDAKTGEYPPDYVPPIDIVTPGQISLDAFINQYFTSKWEANANGDVDPNPMADMSSNVSIVTMPEPHTDPVDRPELEYFYPAEPPKVESGDIDPDRR
ncbi:MAG: hypothetical protein AB7U20_09850 [Planctomycetaceae bacterium]